MEVVREYRTMTSSSLVSVSLPSRHHFVFSRGFRSRSVSPPTHNDRVRRIVVDQATVNEQVLDEAVRAVLRGGVIAIPTDTLYGLAVDPFRAEAVERVFVVKGRAAERALPLVAADVDQVTIGLAGCRLWRSGWRRGSGPVR